MDLFTKKLTHRIENKFIVTEEEGKRRTNQEFGIKVLTYII